MEYLLLRKTFYFLILFASTFAHAQNKGTIKVKKVVSDSVIPKLDTVSVKFPRFTFYPAFYYSYISSKGYKNFSVNLSSGKKFLSDQLLEYGADIQGLGFIKKQEAQGWGSFIGFGTCQKQEMKVSDSINYSFSEYHLHAQNWYCRIFKAGGAGLTVPGNELPLVEGFVGGGLEYGRAKLIVSNLKISKNFIYTNPFLALHPSVILRMNIFLRKTIGFFFGVKSDYAYDIGHTAWKNKNGGNYSIPGLDQSAFYFQGYFGIYFWGSINWVLIYCDLEFILWFAKLLSTNNLKS